MAETRDPQKIAAAAKALGSVEASASALSTTLAAEVASHQEITRKVESASKMFNTFRIGMERAEPLSALAENIDKVFKKAALVQARSALRQEGRKLDPQTKQAIIDSYDVVADALRNGQQGAFDAAEARLKAIEESIMRLPAGIQKDQQRIALDNAKKLLKAQKKNSVSFFGEMEQEFREGPLATLEQKLSGNFFGRMLLRFAKDRIASARAYFDEAAKRQALSDEAAREQAEMQREQSMAGHKIAMGAQEEETRRTQEILAIRAQDREALLYQMRSEGASAEDIAKVEDQIAKAKQHEALLAAQLARISEARREAEELSIERAEASARGEDTTQLDAQIKYLADKEKSLIGERQRLLDAAQKENELSADTIASIKRSARDTTIAALKEAADNPEIQAMYETLERAAEKNADLTVDALMKINENGELVLDMITAERLRRGDLTFREGRLQSGAETLGRPGEPTPTPAPVILPVQPPILSQQEMLQPTPSSGAAVDEWISDTDLESINESLTGILTNTSELTQTSNRILKDGLGANSPGVLVTTLPQILENQQRSADGLNAGATTTPTTPPVSPTVNASAVPPTAAASPAAAGMFGGIIGAVKKKFIEFGQSTAQFATEIKTESLRFVRDVQERVIAPEARTATQQAAGAAEGSRQAAAEGSKYGFLVKLIGAGNIDKIKNFIGTLKSGFGRAIKGIGEAITGIFNALAEGLKKLANPQVLQGGLVLLTLSGALLAFAGAMYLFGLTNWGGALLGIGVFAAFVTAMVLLAPMLAPIAPLLTAVGAALLAITLPLAVFAASLFILGLAMQMFAGIGIVGLLGVAAFLGVLAALSPLLAVGGIGLALAAPGYLLFGLALVSLGLGMSVFGASALALMPQVIALLGALALISPLLAIASVFLAVASVGYLLFGAALISLGLGMQMFVGTAGAILPAIGILMALAAISPLLMLGSLLLLLAAPGYLLFGLALISLGLGMQMFLGTAGAILPAIALLGALAVLATFLYPASLLLIGASVGFLVFGFALMSLGIGLSTFVGSAGAILPAIALLFTLAALAIPLLIASIALGLATPGLALFGLALMSLGAGLQYFAGTIGAFIPAVALLTALALLGPMLLLSSVMLALAAPGLIIFGGALMVLGTALSMFGASVGEVALAMATLFALGMMAPMLVIAGIGLAFAAPGFIAFGAAMLVLGVGLVLIGTGMKMFSDAVATLTTSLLSIVGLALVLPLLALGLAGMVLLLLPLVVPMLIVAAAIFFFALAIGAFAKTMGFLSTAQASAAIPESVTEAETTINVGALEMNNMPFSYPEIMVVNVGGANQQNQAQGMAEQIMQVFNSISAPQVLIGGGGSGGGGDKLRNDENTFRRVQERFYNAALI